MGNVFQICEHAVLPDDLNPYVFNETWEGGLCLNPHANDFHKRYLFVWDNCYGQWCYHATYTIGAWWLSESENKALSVTTEKIEKIDFIKMFSVCLESGLEAEHFQRIYGIKSDAKPIKISKLDSVISPLIITHYICVLKELVAGGLKKDYVFEEDNIAKLKGKLQIPTNQRLNINRCLLHKFYGRYQEHTIDIPENRLLKKSLLFAERVLSRFAAKSSQFAKIQRDIQFCKTAFCGVSEDINISTVKCMKSNKLFKGYSEAIRLAKIILKHYDFSITKADSEQESVIPFWIDMALLYEHYVHGLLKQAFGEKIVYQKRGITGVPDFLYKDKENPLILDTKYIDMSSKDTSDLDVGIIRQLSGYARDTAIRKELGVDEMKIIPCIYLYPSDDVKSIASFEGTHLEESFQPLSGLLKFHKIGIKVPIIV